MTTRTPHAPSVSRVLARAGFDRFSAETTSVRGWYRYASGYRVESAAGLVLVHHETLDDRPERDERAHPIIVHEFLPKYRDALIAAGYRAGIADDVIVVS